MTYQMQKMGTPCAQCPLRSRDVFEPFSDSELAFMEGFKTGEMLAEPGTQLFIEGSKSAQLFTVLSGLGIRYKLLENGKRQVVNFIMPGDFLGLQSAVMSGMGHTAETTTQMRLCVFNRSRIFDLYKNHPERAFDLTFLASAEEHFLGDALATVGQRSAIEKISWSLHRFFVRAKSLGLAKNNKCPFPYRQQDLADALGLSLVHTNKTLARIRDKGLAVWNDGSLLVLKEEGLAELAMADSPAAARRPLI